MSAPPAIEARFTLVAGRAPSAFTLDVDLALDHGVLVLFGPSGAGKSLTLQALAGLVAPARGLFRASGETIFDTERRLAIPAHRRRIGYVPQHHTLFPFLDVAGNVAFGLPRADRKKGSPKIAALLDEFGLAHLASASAGSLSGGERQRVALARALAVEPRLLLLDEPFASIDHAGRAALRTALRAAVDRRRIPAVLVTHDREEALALGDRLVRYERGRTAEIGAPAALLARGRRVVITGDLASAPRPTTDGRAAIDLHAATIEAPAELLAPAITASDRVRLDVIVDDQSQSTDIGS